MPDHNGKVALVTGGGSGIGKAAVLRFAEAGAKVAIADANGDAAQAVTEAVRDGGGEALAIRVDVSDPDACVHMIEEVRATYGRLDSAFNNAGITEVSLLKDAPIPETHELPLDIWQKIIAIDLNGVFYCLRAELPLMLEGGGGAIVNTASLQGHISDPRTAAYTAAKHGVIGVTKTIAKEYGNRGVRCNAVSPGVVNTPLTEKVIFRPEYKDALLAPIPLGRFAEARDIAQAVVWLCCDEAAYLNGITLPVDGGYLA